MKAPGLPFALALLLAGCSTTNSPKGKADPKLLPETVLVTYNVKPGREAELEAVLFRVWEIYRRENLVFAQPHVIVRDAPDGKPRITEILTWVNHAAPDQAPAEVKAAWKEMHALCEARDGRGGLQGGEVELIVPKAK
jgi:hypothetical protein